MKRRVLIPVALAFALAIAQGQAQTVSETQVQPSRASAPARTQPQQLDPYRTLDAKDRLQAQIFDLSEDEILRAKTLELARTDKNHTLTPIEILGIHARNDAERQKYAEKAARYLHDDIERVLVFQEAFSSAFARLYGDVPVLDYSRVTPRPAPVGAADALGVPRSAVIDTSPSAARSLLEATSAPQRMTIPEREP